MYPLGVNNTQRCTFKLFYLRIPAQWQICKFFCECRWHMAGAKTVYYVLKYWWEPSCADIGGFMTLYGNLLRNILWIMTPQSSLYLHQLNHQNGGSINEHKCSMANQNKRVSQHALLSLLCLPKWTWQRQRQFESSDRSQTHTHAFTLMCFQSL